jgi:hypothetical protein
MTVDIRRFRWVALQLDELAKCHHRPAVKNRLRSLPKDLDETYDRIISKINDDDRDYAVKVLQCLTFAARPMTLEEVGEVVAINFNAEEGLDDALVILDICSSLVTLVASTEEPEIKLKGKCYVDEVKTII